MNEQTPPEKPPVPALTVPPGCMPIGIVWLNAPGPQGQQSFGANIASPALDAAMILMQLALSFLTDFKKAESPDKKLIVVPELTGIGPPPKGKGL